MNRLEGFLNMLDSALNTKKKRHIAGGILMSVSLLCTSLAVTIMTLRTEVEDNEQEYIE